MSADTPTPEHVTLTEEERALGQQHTPHRWFREDAVERIVAAREQALCEKIATRIENERETPTSEVDLGYNQGIRDAASIARGGAR